MLSSLRPSSLPPSKKGISSHSNELWPSIKYRHYNDTRTLSLYFTKAVKGLIDNSDEVRPGLLVDYTSSGRIVSIDFNFASSKMHCHFLDTLDIIDNKPAFQLTSSYSASQDELTIKFTASSSSGCTLLATDDEHLLVGVDEHGHWQTLAVKKASAVIAR